MEKQLNSFTDQFPLPCKRKYRKGYSTLSALLALLERSRSFADKMSFLRAVLMDLIEVFDTVEYELLLAK